MDQPLSLGPDVIMHSIFNRLRPGKVLRASLAASALVLLLGPASAQTWIATSGQWATGTNWQGGVAPVSSNTTALTFNSLYNQGISSTYNGGLGFQINSLTINSNSISTIPFTLSGFSTSHGIQFAGSGAAINFNGVSGATMSSGGAAYDFGAGGTTFNGNGLGTFLISGTIGSGNLTVNGSSASPLAGWLTLSGSNSSWAGTLTVNSGTVNANSTTAFGSGAINVNGGTLGFQGTTYTLNNAMTVGANGMTFATTGSSAGTITLSQTSSLSGGGDLRFRSMGTATTNSTFNVQSAYANSGIVNLDQPGTTLAASAPAVKLQLSSASSSATNNGSMLNATDFQVRGGSFLMLDNTNKVNQRIGSTANVSLSSGELQVKGNSTTATTMSMGTLGIQGLGVVTLTASSTAGVAVTASSISRNNRGVLFLRGELLGAGAPASGRGNLFATTAPTLVGGGGASGTTNMSILPWGYGETSSFSSGSSASFLTYDAVGGLRPLTAAEMAGAFGASDLNVLLASSPTLSGNVSANSLTLSSSATSIGGSGIISLSGGAILNRSSTSIASTVGLDFGSAEGIFISPSNLTVNGVITGTNGITKVGNGTLTLNGVNTYGGTTTINGGNIQFALASAFGNSTQINVAGGAWNSTGSASSPTSGAGLSYTGNLNATLTQGINVLSGNLALTSVGTNRLILSGNITGSGGVVVGPVSGNGEIELTGNNTYTGVTRVNSGKLFVNSDNALGAGNTVDLAATLTATGTINSTKGINFSGSSSVIDTGSNLVLFGGTITGSGSFTKQGSGTLILSGNGAYTGSVSIGNSTTNGGSLYVNGTVLGSSITSYTVTNGQLGGSGTVGSISLATAGQISPGALSGQVGTLTAASLSYANNATMNFDMSAASNDLLIVGATFNKSLAANILNFNFNDLGVTTGSYDLVKWGSTTSTFNLGTDFTATWNNPLITGNFQITGNTLQYVVTAVPEPTTMVALGLGAVALIRRRRKNS